MLKKCSQFSSGAHTGEQADPILKWFLQSKEKTD